MVHGFGIYDGEPGKARENIFYGFWSRMIYRCYSESYLKRMPTYRGTTICEEWKYFSNFEKWAVEHYVDGYELDKDFINCDLKTYSPETCAFIPQELNSALLIKENDSEYPIGVYYKQKSKGMINERKKPYVAQIAKYGKLCRLGHFSTPFEAHKKWQESKMNHLIELKSKYTNIVDECVLIGLQKRIDMLKEHIDKNIITESLKV